ncbi:MAG TPA: hypothetical protein VHD31_00680 [Candidatus Paceibacterota bacterium]|nr:hypothetical protein [Candidatus Paceibacterota bacterium]
MEIPSPQDRNQKPEQGVGPLFGIVIIVVLLLAGGIYFLFMQEQSRNAVPANQEQANS